MNTEFDKLLATYHDLGLSQSKEQFDQAKFDFVFVSNRLESLFIYNSSITGFIESISKLVQNRYNAHALVDGMIEQSNEKIKCYLEKIINQHLTYSIDTFKQKTKQPNKGFGLIL